MDAASEAAAAAPTAAAPAGSTPMDLPSFPAERERAIPAELDLLSDVNLNVKIELGRTRLLIDDVLRLNEGSVVELDKLAGDPVDIYVNDRHIARGEVLVLNDNFCIRVNEIIDPEGKQAG
ncbi:flagellar motor switch protein FliN [bacterium AH-315-K20]|nr:flagellar motor switch protein FliN [bacterium AH-315-K20]